MPEAEVADVRAILDDLTERALRAREALSAVGYFAEVLKATHAAGVAEGRAERVPPVTDAGARAVRATFRLVPCGLAVPAEVA